MTPSSSAMDWFVVCSVHDRPTRNILKLHLSLNAFIYRYL